MPDCERCGKPYELPTGRGGRSPYCEPCKLERRAAQQQQRSLRHAMATVAEWVDALGPTIIEWKQEVSKRQDDRCANCGAEERLYLGRDEVGLNALCLACHEEWRNNARAGAGTARPGDGPGERPGEHVPDGDSGGGRAGGGAGSDLALALQGQAQEG